jgi:hypothetical protein
LTGQTKTAQSVTETLRKNRERRLFRKENVTEMKVFGFTTGMALGMAAAAAAVSVMYPDVPRRMKKDGRHVINSMKKLI